jgi:site-specific DNA recombinase
MTTTAPAPRLAPELAPVPGIIYLRLSDFRDEDDTTFEAREAELRELADEIGCTPRVMIENDLNADGRPKGASAYKTPRRVTTAAGLVEFRTNRPVFQAAVRALIEGSARVLIVGDDTRIARNERDGLDLLDAARVSGASVVAPDEDGGPRFILTNGGTVTERDRLQDRIGDARRYSADIAAKTRKGRARWAGRSYHGGPRPFGYRVDLHTAQHQRGLVVDEAEAAAARKAAGDLLAGVSLAAVTRELQATVAPVRAAEWSTRSVRDMLLKPAMSGQAIKRGQLVPATWPAIIDPETQARLAELFADPARRTRKGGNQPRWLVSCFARCGVCQGTVRVGGAGSSRGPAYVGSACGHLRRNAVLVDELIGDHVVEWLDRFAGTGAMLPRAAEPVNAEALRAERDKLTRQRTALLDSFEGEPEVEALITRKAARIAEIGELLTASYEADPLDGWREGDPRALWEAAPIGRRRVLVQTLIESVTINRAGKGRAFDPETVAVRWHPQAQAA